MGRRNLLLMGSVGMAVCQFIVAITGTVAGTTDVAAQRAAIAFVCIYIYFFASTWGPTGMCSPPAFHYIPPLPTYANTNNLAAWVVTGELFPLKVRAKALSMTTGTYSCKLESGKSRVS